MPKAESACSRHKLQTIISPSKPCITTPSYSLRCLFLFNIISPPCPVSPSWWNNPRESIAWIVECSLCNVKWCNVKWCSHHSLVWKALEPPAPTYILILAKTPLLHRVWGVPAFGIFKREEGNFKRHHLTSINRSRIFHQKYWKGDTGGNYDDCHWLLVATRLIGCSAIEHLVNLISISIVIIDNVSSPIVNLFIIIFGFILNHFCSSLITLLASLRVAWTNWILI